MLPRCYRTGSTAPTRTGSDPNSFDPDAIPVYKFVPNRWLVVRRLRSSAPAGNGLPEYQAWVIESDRVSRIDDLGPGVDLEVDVAPFVLSGDPNMAGQAKLQSEIFLGMKLPAEGWKENTTAEVRVKALLEMKLGTEIRQRVSLTINSSSNPFFADQTSANSNVFSVLDNFAYGSSTQPSYLTNATADYCVIGWHSNGKNDPFTGDPRELRDRLPDLFMNVTDPNDPQLNLAQDTASLCHGSMYTVNFDRFNRPKIVLADNFGKNFYKGTKMEPISIGATPLDSLIAFLRAHDVDGSLGSLSSLSQDVVKIASLLMAADGGYDSQVQAQDLLYGYNFDASDGGTEWHFIGDSQPGAAPDAPAIPSASDLIELRALAESQRRLNVITKDVTQKRWELFAMWWKLVSDRDNSAVNGNSDPAAIQARYQQQASALHQTIVQLAQTQATLQSEIAAQNIQGRFKKAAKLPFYSRKDPTISISGMDSGWPANWLSSLLVRFENEIPAGPVNPNLQAQSSALPTELQSSANRIFGEFLAGPNTATNENFKFTIPWWKSWNDTQPWFPLFVEWEAVYYHIPKDSWKVETINMGNPPHPMVRYAVDTSLDSGQYLQDVRTISGRVPILPQAALALQTLVATLVSSFPKDNTSPITSVERAQLLDPTLWAQFKYLSLRLSGFTDHLITRVQGSHVKPNARMPDKSLKALADAVAASAYGQQSPIFPAEFLNTIMAESSVTPYGNLINFEDITVFPFKAVTSGQAMFTKLNIIDKFGQAIPALEPKPRLKAPTQPPPSIYPCMSDYLTPNSIGGFPNVVFRDQDMTLPSRFVQFTPSINQDARINGSFVKKAFEKLPDGSDDTTKFRGFWEPVSDWDQPIWGWIVVNYADYGLQFFLADGTFYTEVRVGGPHGTSQQETKWLPFGVPTTKVGNPLLDGLIAKLTADANPEYLYAFADMINESIKAMPATPNQYADYISSIVGKPLALVNTSWSVELSQPPFQPQNTLGNTTVKPGEEVTSYKFPIKLGDWSRPFDGMVAYFDMNPDLDTINFDQINTYFVSKASSAGATAPDPRHLINENLPFPKISPYFDAAPTTPDPFTKPNTTPALDTDARRGYVTAMLVDPFTPVHCYTPILPIQSLLLSNWTIQSALQKITAFFHLGPISVTADVPTTFNPAMEPKELAAQGPYPDGTPSVNLPMSSRARWRWLQPYAEPNAAEPDGSGIETKYNALPLGTDDGSPRFMPGPYSMLEGYLQLLEPAVKPASVSTG